MVETLTKWKFAKEVVKMINNFGEWEQESDYSSYPKGKWCDLDYVANYINEQQYVPKTTMENLALNLIAYFEGETESEDSEFLPAYNENLMINIAKLSAFVFESGGLESFDYEL